MYLIHWLTLLNEYCLNFSSIPNRSFYVECDEYYNLPYHCFLRIRLVGPVQRAIRLCSQAFWGV